MGTQSNNTLDGLVTPNTAQLRAGWWAYKLYSDGVPTRVLSASSERQVVALASAGSAVDQQAQVLIGYFDAGKSPPAVDIILALYNLRALPFLQAANSVLVGLRGIPDSGEAELAEPQFLGNIVLHIGSDGSAHVTLPSLAIHHGLVLSIGNAV